MKYFERQRLHKLMALLPHVPAERFRMSTFFRGVFCARDNEHQHEDCGSAACAMGWACTIKSFKRAGLHIMEYEHAMHGLMQVPEYQGMIQMDAAKRFFGLTGHEATYLFGCEHSNNPKQAADRIRIVLDGKLDSTDFDMVNYG